MFPRNHAADAFSLQMAVGAGLVDAPSPAWWPEGGAWLVRATSRNSAGDWVLTRDGGYARFSEHHQAQAVAEALPRGGPLF
jgi:hypothetical protein